MLWVDKPTQPGAWWVYHYPRVSPRDTSPFPQQATRSGSLTELFWRSAVESIAGAVHCVKALLPTSAYKVCIDPSGQQGVSVCEAFPTKRTQNTPFCVHVAAGCPGSAEHTRSSSTVSRIDWPHGLPVIHQRPAKPWWLCFIPGPGHRTRASWAKSLDKGLSIGKHIGSSASAGAWIPWQVQGVNALRIVYLRSAVLYHFVRFLAAPLCVYKAARVRVRIHVTHADVPVFTQLSHSQIQGLIVNVAVGIAVMYHCMENRCLPHRRQVSPGAGVPEPGNRLTGPLTRTSPRHLRVTTTPSLPPRATGCPLLSRSSDTEG